MANVRGERGKTGARRAAALALLEANPAGLRSGEVAELLSVSRQAAFSHLTSLVESGCAERVGRGRGTRYRSLALPVGRATAATAMHRFGPADEWDVDALITAEPFDSMSRAARELFAGALLRMLRMGRQRCPDGDLLLRVTSTTTSVELELGDSGEGLFAMERRLRGLSSSDDAMRVLTRAADDSDFSWLLRAAECFEVESEGLALRVDNLRTDYCIVSLDESRAGTRMRFCADALRPMRVEALEARLGTTACVHVRLFTHGDHFPSRDEARRLMEGLESSRRVVLDFGGVREVGEGFARELFCVWAGEHPGVRLDSIRMRESVAAAILRAHRDA